MRYCLNEIRANWFKRTVQTITYMPYFLSWVVVAGLLNTMLSPDNGAINTLIKALPHNSSAALAMPFLPSASCRNLDLPPVNLRFLQSHLTKNAFAIAPTHLCGIALEPKE